ncbi:MAG: hypothetical protein P8184_11635 [Calditrichia bacterium]
MPKAKGLLLMLMLLSVVLYCDKKQGREKELENFGDQTVAPAPLWAQRGVLLSG